MESSYWQRFLIPYLVESKDYAGYHTMSYLRTI